MSINGDDESNVDTEARWSEVEAKDDESNVETEARWSDIEAKWWWKRRS
jgi:hypothetical protein